MSKSVYHTRNQFEELVQSILAGPVATRLHDEDARDEAVIALEGVLLAHNISIPRRITYLMASAAIEAWRREGGGR